MTGQTKNNRSLLQIKEMDKEERWSHIKFPLIMLVLLILGAIIFSVGFFIEQRSLIGVYIVVGVFTYLILLFVTDWWEAMKNWRNGRICKRSHPEVWKKMQEDKKIREIERKRKK